MISKDKLIDVLDDIGFVQNGGDLNTAVFHAGFDEIIELYRLAKLDGFDSATLVCKLVDERGTADALESMRAHI